MSQSKDKSLDNIAFTDWRWSLFLEKTINSLSSFDIEPLPIPKDFLYKETILGPNKKSFKVKTATWACKTSKLKKIRAACIDGGEIASVLNLVINPLEEFDLPFFGADFVSLPNGHLIALDLQPILKQDIVHTQLVWKRLLPIYKYWQSKLPSGGIIPEEAKSFFSPAFLWSRLPNNTNSDDLIKETILPAFNDYLDLYLELVDEAVQVSSSRAEYLLEGQRRYLNYRAEKDPARSMLTRFYGKEWTESYIHNILFN